MSKIAILVDHMHMFEDSELRVPLDRLRGAGHDAALVGLEAEGVPERTQPIRAPASQEAPPPVH